MKTCFGYVRVSTAKQGEGVSLEAQKEAIETFATRKDIQILKWFEEKETAAKSGRPVFNQMVSELRRGRAGGVIIHKIDRSARNFADWAKIGDLSDAGIDVHFATESLDFRSRGGRLTADIQAVIAADYIRNLRDETIKGLRGRLKQGLYPFKAPLGYLDNGGGKPKTIDPHHGPQVRQLFKLYATGNYSLWGLRKKANELGITNYGGKPISKTSIEKILRNPFYAGVIRINANGETFAGVHEPLISVALFDEVAAVREGRDNKKTTKHHHRYRGLFRCAFCDGAMISELQKGRVYLRCHTPTCPTKTVREDDVERQFTEFLASYDLDPTQTQGFREKAVIWINEKYDDSSAQQSALAIAKLDGRLTRLEDKLVDDVIDEEVYKRKRQETLLHRQKLVDDMKLQDKKTRLVTILNKFLELGKILSNTYQNALPVGKRHFVRFATSNRLVSGKKLELEPSPWLALIADVQKADWCDPSRASSRTFSALEDIMNKLDPEDIELLFKALAPDDQRESTDHQ